MNDIIEYEMQRLGDLIETDEISVDKSNNFVINSEWEDEFSHNDIYKMQKEFTNQAKEYLKLRSPDKYVIFTDWCVHICTKEFADNNAITNYMIC